ncbi:CHAT domain-containing protein [Nostoc sphaeroides CHAB 2801]|uniref:CHAT domain-containing protein n=1 Tax=Nostoc sphaeroides TaxID=446679 RepID=UPI000E4D6442|nr:CHAT domain-containing protein [Nostoc sphaeroides]MCC5627041.1 CHAT domain-containing protein [Nostoc sphaeroides CHAB 2801]
MTSQAIKNNLLLLANAIAVFSVNQILPTTAQNITPANNNDTGTIVNTNGNLIDIGGGAVSGNGANLFHSFQKFNLDANQTANFLSNPTIQNILGRVVGGDLSLINGLIQVTGSNANLFLMNPAGIVFGANAMLNVPASFTATTATGISFNNGSYNSLSNNNYSILDGNPIGFNFANQQPGSIINLANLELSNPNQNLSLVAGTVVSTGQVSAPNGNLTIASVEGGKFLRISQTGNLISLEIPTNGATSGNITVASLPQLLTGSGLDNTSELTVNSNGQVQLTASNIPINSGDVVVKRITSQTATLSAANNLTLPESQLTTTGDLNLLARDTVRVRDSVTNRVGVQAGGNLYIQGNQSIDILALNHPQTPFVSGGNLSLVSDGVISGDAHFASGGQFKILNLSGGAGTFVSYYDPIIRANGDVEFGDYTGAALKVETTGGIQGGNITITSPDISGSILSGDPDFTALTTSNAVILRAGLSGVTTVNFPSTQETTAFTLPASPLPTGSITVGNINTSSTVAGQSGPITLEAPGNINTGNLNSSATDSNSGGAITLTTTGGSINTGSSINSSGSASSGNITLNGNINLTADTTINAGSGSISVPIYTINGASNLTLSASDITLGGAVGGTTPLTGLTATADNTNVANNITTTGNIQFDSPITLTGADTKIFNSNNNNIDLTSTVDGASNLNVNAGTGNITLSGAVGGTTALTSLTTTAANTNIANNITTTGNIQFNSPVTLTGADTKIFNANTGAIAVNNTLAAGANNLTLTANEIDFNGGNNSVTGSGELVLQPSTASRNINLGQASDSDTSTFDLTTSELTALQDGFSLITIGRNDGSGSVNFAPGLSFLDPITIQSPNGQLNTQGTISSNNNNITLNGNVNLSADTSINAGSGSINFVPISTINGARNLTLSANDITLGGAVGGTTALTGLTATAANTNVANNITTTGNIQFDSPVTLTGDDTKTFNSNNNNIDLTSTVDGASNLNVNAGTGNITLGGVVGGTTALTSLTATAANTNVANNITTTGNIQFNSPVTLTGDSSKTFTANTGAIAVNNTLAAGANNLTLTANEIDFNGGNNSVTGSGELVLQPSTPSRNINLGQTSDSDISTFDLTTSELTALQDGFSLITIGRNDGTGTVNIAAGVSFKDPMEILSLNGSIISGTLTGTDNASITLSANQINITDISTNNNDINLNGNTELLGNTTLDAGTATIEINGSLATGSNNLNLIADEIDLRRRTVFDSVTGTGNLALQPKTPSQNITINNSDDSGVDTLDLTISDIGALADGFNSITIGRTDGSGLTTTFSPLIFSDPVTIQANADQGRIDAFGPIEGRDNASINLQAGGDILTNEIFTQGGAINLNSTNGVIITGTLDSNFSDSDKGGDITVAAPGGILVLGGVNTSSFAGEGGSVSLSSDNDIEVSYINAQGGSFGGDVNVSTKNFFRATGVFFDQNGTFPSISTSGGFGSGNIRISHGGNNIRSFVVGNPFINGTAGAITSNPFNRISPDLSLPDSYRQEDIQIITNEQLPDADTDTSKSVPQPNPVIVNINNTPQVPLDNIIAARDEQLTRKFEQYLGQENSTSIKSVAEVQATLNQIQKQTDTKTAVFYVKFSPSNDSSTRDKDTLDLVILTGEGKAILEPITGVTRAKVRQVAQQFYDTISDVNQAGTSNYLTSAQQLYKWLIAPQEAELQKQGITNIAFILDEGLRSIPMAALHDGKQFLIEKYSLAVLPSFSLTDTSYASLKKSRVLAMGASKFTQEQKQEPLLAVPLEVATIAQIWQGTSLLEKNFTLNNLKSKRQQNPFSIIHLATHVDFVSGTDNQSYIQLYDQKLRLNQVRELGWSQPPVELLVLSACKSAFGDENAELGFAGLAIQTGVKSAVASLWYVSDAGTLGLMTDFYSQLKIVPIKAEALRQAQIAMIQGKVKIENNKLIATNNNIELSPEIADYLQKNVVGNLSHPFYWAPFTMIGSPW